MSYDPYEVERLYRSGQIRCLYSGKMSFKTKKSAKKVRRLMEVKYHKYFRIYSCPHCGNFHLTTVQTKKERK